MKGGRAGPKVGSAFPSPGTSTKDETCGWQAIGFLAAVVMSAGCGSPEARADLPDSGRVVDSIIPREEAVRRFRAGLSPVDSLAGGARTRDALVKAFVRALGESDTAALAGLTVSRAEFAYLYYPTAAEGKPPYDLEPGLMWFMLSQRSNTGVRQGAPAVRW